MWTAATVAAFVVALTGFPATAYAGSAAAPSEQDKNYLVTAHQFNLARIDSGQLARLKAMSASLRDIASKIVTDHLALDEALIPVAAQVGVVLPARVTDAQQATQSDLAAMAAGAEFDRQWTTAELSAHTTAISQNDAEINRGTEPAVIKVAQDAAAVLALHHTRLMGASTAASPPSHVDSGSGGLADPRRMLIPLAITGAGLLLILAGATLRRRSLR
jgi:predicted outer membrane protein